MGSVYGERNGDRNGPPPRGCLRSRPTDSGTDDPADSVLRFRGAPPDDPGSRQAEAGEEEEGRNGGPDRDGPADSVAMNRASPL